MGKLMQRLTGMGLGLLAGFLSSLAFKQVWKAVAHEDDAPDAMDEERGWREVLIAAALQGAIFGATKAVVDRSSATTVRRLTGKWPS